MEINCLCMKGENKVCFSKLLSHYYLDSGLWNKEATPHFCIFQKVLYFPTIGNRYSIALSILPEKTLKLVIYVTRGQSEEALLCFLCPVSFPEPIFRLVN